LRDNGFMDNRASSLIDNLQHFVFDYIPLVQSPAEADMLRFLIFYTLSPYNVMENSSLPRLRNLSPWDFYNAIYDSDYAQPIDITQNIAAQFTQLKFENELSLNETEKNLSPYHPLLNNLPPLLLPDKMIDFTSLECFKITEAQPYLDLKYDYFKSKTHLCQQIHDLNITTDRNARLNRLVYVKRIKEHPYFDGLNGQRGVFAKTDITAGTIIDYYSGEYAQYPQAMPPILCTWRVQKSENWLKYAWQHRNISRFNGWTDAFILGNMMKLVNSCYSHQKIISDIGNIACYFFHFKSRGLYLSLPVYVATKDIPKNTELLTFYHVGDYKTKRVYSGNV
jgi:hypothetical protein